MEKTNINIYSFSKKETEKLLAAIESCTGNGQIILRLEYDSDKKTLMVYTMQVEE